MCPLDLGNGHKHKHVLGYSRTTVCYIVQGWCHVFPGRGPYPVVRSMPEAEPFPMHRRTFIDLELRSNGPLFIAALAPLSLSLSL